MPGSSASVDTRTFTNGWSPSVPAAILGAFAVGGVAVGAEFGVLPAIGTAALGVVLVFLISTFRTKMTITCDAEGVTVLTSSRRLGEATRRFAWTDVTCARTETRESTGGEHSTTARVFIVEGRAGVLLELSDSMRDFKAVVDVFRERAASAATLRSV